MKVIISTTRDLPKEDRAGYVRALMNMHHGIGNHALADKIGALLTQNRVQIESDYDGLHVVTTYELLEDA